MGNIYFPNDEPGCKCNICSLRFLPIPHFHMSGNMMLSQCSHISKLVHPSNFTSAMIEMIRSAPNEKFGNIMQSSKAWEIGLGHFAAEHWVGSHPDRQAVYQVQIISFLIFAS